MPILARRVETWKPVVESVAVVPDPEPPPPVGTFTHPGVMYSAAQLNYVKQQLAVGAQPWTTEYSNVTTRTVSTTSESLSRGVAYSSLSWIPHPVSVVRRHSSGSNSVGDADLICDGQAALVHALIWAYKGTRANALKAIEIINAWSGTITEIVYDVSTSADGKLLAGWTGTLYARAAEIIRHTFTPAGGETALNVTRLSQKFRDVWLPKLTVGHNGGGANWLMSFCDSIVQIGVFLDDQAVFEDGLAKWRQWVPSIFYMRTDVPRWSQLAGMPIPPPQTMYDVSTITEAKMRTYWYGLNTAVGQHPNGVAGESGRDAHHSAMGFAAALNVAETCRHQGVDLYGEQRARLVAAMETNANWNYQRWVQGVLRPSGFPFAKDMVGFATSTQRTTWEIGYQQYANRLGVSMPQTARLLADYVRPTTYVIDLMIVGETLTHYGTP
jgi:hypothetical protein